MSAAIRRAARPGTSGGTANLEGGMEREYLLKVLKDDAAHALGRKRPVACEYAKCKNHGA
jgi:hypothetical protein